MKNNNRSIFVRALMVGVMGVCVTSVSAQTPKPPRKIQPRITGQGGVVATVGKMVTLKGTLKHGRTGAGLPERELKFTVRWDKEWIDAGSATTSESGTASVEVKAQSTTKKFFNYRIHFAGETEPDDGVIHTASKSAVFVGKVISPPENDPDNGGGDGEPAEESTAPAPSASKGASKPPPKKAAGGEEMPPDEGPDDTGGGSGGDGGGDEGGSAADSLPIRDLLKSALGSQAGSDFPSEELTEKFKISKFAVPFIPQGFSGKYPRFWIDATVNSFDIGKSGGIKDKIIALGGGKAMAVKAGITYRVIDALTGVHYFDGTVEKKAVSLSFKKAVKVKLPGKGSSSNTEQEVSLADVLKTNDSKVVKDALREAVNRVNKDFRQQEPLFKVISVAKKPANGGFFTMLILRGDDESALKVGEPMGLFKMESITDEKEQVIRVDFEKVGEARVKRISTSSHTLDCELVKMLPGKKPEKGMIASKVNLEAAS